MAYKKAGCSSRNGRDSHSKRVGVKRFGGELVSGGSIIVRQRGTQMHPGDNVGIGKDYILMRSGTSRQRAGFAAGLDSIREGRNARARRIGESLAAAGIPEAYEGAMRFVTSERLVSRTHFARFLIDAGHAREMKDVFRRYLSPGRPGHVDHRWATLQQAIGWIHGAGGVAVLAHPGRYKVSGERGMRQLLAEFRDAGGDAIEVLSSSHTPAQAVRFATLARVHGFSVSVGSDFHGPGEGSLDLGDLPPLPAGVEPVWSRW